MPRAEHDPELSAQIRYLAGPTGVGKSEIALEVAEQLDAEIIGVDAFQVYRGLEILTAQPLPAMRQRVPHHLVNCVRPEDPFDAVTYVAMAQQAAREILGRGKVPLAVGGTGLYFHALQHGFDEMLPSDPTLRAELDAMSLAALQAEYAIRDPFGAAKIDLQNPRRLVRALEVCRLSERPYSSFRRDWSHRPKVVSSSMRAVFLERPREQLYARIDSRVEQMFRAGVAKEIESLPAEISTAAQALGLREVQAIARGEISEREAISTIQQATRRYVKRQLTWFRKQPAFTWHLLTAADSPSSCATQVALLLNGQSAPQK